MESLPRPILAATVNGHWVHDLDPFLFRIGDTFGVRWYGLSYLLGFLVAAWLLVRYAKAGRSQLPRDQVEPFMFWIVLGVMLGGRLGSFVLYNFRDLVADPLGFFRYWEGGMASHGGFVGVLVAIWLFSRSRRLPFLHLGDLVASTTAAGLCLGRVANFINGELWGRVSQVPWAVIFPGSAESIDTPLGQIPPRHPSQLYEAALEGALVFAIIQWRFWRTDLVARQPGRIGGEFLLAYAIARIVGELFREPDASLILGLSRGIFYSLFLGVAGMLLILRAARQARSIPGRV